MDSEIKKTPTEKDWEFKKINEDQWYKRGLIEGWTYEEFLKAGWVNDQLEVHSRQLSSWDCRWNWKKAQKIENWYRQWEENHASKDPVILLSTGSFAPMHWGHVMMMEQAKKKMQAYSNVCVIGGLMSPSHDRYVLKKNEHTQTWPHEKRIFWMQKLLQDVQDLDVWEWESRYASSNLNFTDVIEHAQQWLQYRFPEVKVVYVFGQDNAGFARVFHHEDEFCCVERNMNKKNPHEEKDARDWSSTWIRQGHWGGIPSQWHDLFREVSMNMNEGVPWNERCILPYGMDPGHQNDHGSWSGTWKDHERKKESVSYWRSQWNNSMDDAMKREFEIEIQRLSDSLHPPLKKTGATFTLTDENHGIMNDMSNRGGRS